MNYQREDAEFLSKTDACQAWVYRPARYGEGHTPCIVMAHGFGLTRDAGLEPYAQKFAGAGFVVVLFDYRHFGASAGEPRQLLSVNRQLEDWANAISFARTLNGVDTKRVALWGTSFSGGHVIVAAAKDGKIAAVSSQCPMMDALAAVRNYIHHAGMGAFLKLGLLGVADQLLALFRGMQVKIPIVAPPGHFAALSSDDAAAGYRALTPPHWRNEICARYALTLSGYRPIAHAEKLQCPVLIQACLHDSLLPASAAVATARKLGTKAELKQYECGHFDIYTGEYFERASDEQLAFYNRVLAPVRNAP
jgi:pimeloyl-ACP methyl ester carboxylesterase